MHTARRTINHQAITGALLGLASMATAGGAIAGAHKPDPFSMADGSWITISGEVESVDADAFTLDYGNGEVIVEMDDGDRDADAYKLLKGDEVTVSGRIDDDFFQMTTIEASSVYVDNLGTSFFASAIDEESAEAWAAAVTVPLEIYQTMVYGTVTEVDDDEFVVDSGLRELRVEVEEMPYNPLDDEGYQKIEVGDRVKVTGQIDADLFEGRELVADSVIKLNRS